MNNIAFIALGSNLGNKALNIEKAIDLLINKYHLTLIETSSLIEYPALLKYNSDSQTILKNSHLNLVAKISTNLSAEKLLNVLHECEKHLGTVKKQNKNWEDRIIDIDILLFNNETINLPNLIVPHYDLLNRSFFLDLICQIDHTIKINGISVLEHRRNLHNKNAMLTAIMNITPDSMSDGGKYFKNNIKKEKLTKDIIKIVKSNIAVIDIGFESTRPNAKLLDSHETEISLLIEVMKIVHTAKEKTKRFYSFPKISIDTNKFETMQYIVKNNLAIDIINDVSNFNDIAKIKLFQNTNHKLILMHSIALPANEAMLKLKCVADVIEVIKNYYLNHLALKYIAAHRLILDPGIGFNKTADQSFYIISHIKQLLTLNVPLFIGHSRKSYIRKILPIKKPIKTDYATFATSLFLINNGTEYLRVHDFANHQQSILLYKTYNQENFLYITS
jgi:dihydropteroate synthase/2-amino-4-hydroxy-6-hydroxymethyldihydropteridine diphosphokinase